MIYVDISLVDNKILGSFIIDSYFFEPSKYDYAFQLIEVFNDRKSEKIGSKGYSDSTKAFFRLQSISGTFYVRCFLRDKEDKGIRTFDSEKLVVSY